MFKEPTGKIFCSTQLDHFNISQPGTSKDLHIPNITNVKRDLETELENLQQRYQEKEGEVTILRTQLKETKNSFNHEHNKVQNEWKKKLGITEKQIQSVTSELEFKVMSVL